MNIFFFLPFGWKIKNFDNIHLCWSTEISLIFIRTLNDMCAITKLVSISLNGDRGITE